MVMFNRSNFRNLKSFIFSGQGLIVHLLYKEPSPACLYAQKCGYVDIYMKWKRDPNYEYIDAINKSRELEAIDALKDCIVRDPNGCIPISAVSKRGKELGVPSRMRVAAYLRKYPAIFEEYSGPKRNLPWFRLTERALAVADEERAICEARKEDIIGRLRKVILMSEDNIIPLDVIEILRWHLGLPHDFARNPEAYLDESFTIVKMEENKKALAVEPGERVLSVMQRNAIDRGVYSEGSNGPIEFALFPALRLRRKIKNWLHEFQKLPYVSPYEDFSHINPNSDLGEKRVVGVAHELLSLFVEHSAKRRRLLFLRKDLRLPQKFKMVFERHPHIFYLSLRGRMHTAILKEAYETDQAIKPHPLSNVRKKYIELINESEVSLRNRALRNMSFSIGKAGQRSGMDLEETKDS